MTGRAFVVGAPLDDRDQLWLIRHGETEWSKSGQHTGRTDLPLTDTGRAQARALRPVVADLHPALVLISPRQRTRETAELAGLRVDAVDPDLAEWDYGEYEGLTTSQIRQRDPGWSLWTHPVPGGEAAAEITVRADRVLKKAAASLAAGPVILVSHGHMSRVLGARWIGLSALDGGLLALGTASSSVLGAEHETPVIRHWNVAPPAGQENS